MQIRSQYSKWLLFLALLAGLLPEMPSVLAQFPFPRRELPPRTPTVINQLPHDPQIEATFVRGVEGLKAGQPADGLETLQSILDGGQDFFFHNEMGQRVRLRDEVKQAIEGYRVEYERLFGTEASELLRQAIQNQDASEVLEVARRFSMTSSGSVAMDQLAQWQRQSGELISAARWYEEFAAHPDAKQRRVDSIVNALICWGEAGVIERSQDLYEKNRDELKAWAKDHMQPVPEEVEVANWLVKVGVKLPFSADADQIIDWKTPFGNSHQAGWATAAPITLKPTWQRPLLDEFDMLPQESLKTAAKHVESVERSMQGRRELRPLPAGIPLAVGDSVISSGYGIVRSFDRSTGELKWPGVIIDDTFEFLFRSSYAPDHPQNSDAQRSDLMQMFAIMRGWRDMAANSLSSDGNSVYAVTGCHLPNILPQQMLQFSNTRDPRLPARDNQLSAYDLESGLLLWTIMGDAPLSPLNAIDDDQPHRSPVYFYGAPLPVNGRLFCLGEERGQVQLFELNPNARLEGEIIWSMGLLDPVQGQDILFRNHRRMSGLMPAYVGGLLVCPTGEGSVVAVDIERRSIVWAHEYTVPDASAGLLQRGPFLRQSMMKSAQQVSAEILDEQRWLDTRVIVCGDRVLVTPPDDDQLLCLNALTGESKWDHRVSQGGWLFVGGVFEDAAIMVGAADIQLLSLADSTARWKAPVRLPYPAGRGVRLGERYLQPLTSNEIAVIDLSAGQLLCRIPFDGAGTVGNLVAHEGQLLVQSPLGLSAFASLNDLERQMEHLAGQEKLLLAGEWALQQGQTDEGIRLLKEVLSMGPHARARQVLCWTMLEGLRTDFTKFEPLQAEIESYCVSREQQSMFLAAVAAGLKQAGRGTESLDIYLRLLAQVESNGRLEEIDANRQVSGDRRIAGDILSLSNSSEVQDRVRLFLQELPAAPSERLHIMTLLGLDVLSNEQIVAALISLKVDEQLAMSRENLALRLVCSRDPVRQGAGLYLLARFSFEHADGVAARRYLSLLKRLSDETLVLDGKSGKALAEELETTPEWKTVLVSTEAWPRHAHVEDATVFTPRNESEIELFGAASAALEGWRFFVDQTGQSIHIYDADGLLRGRIPTSNPTRNPNGQNFGRYVMTSGHTACIVCQDRFLLVDLLSSPVQPRLITSRNLLAPEYADLQAGMNLLQNRPGLRGPTSSSISPLGPKAGNVGSLTSTSLAFTVGNELIVIDPATGSEIWRRRGIPDETEVVGDEAYTVVLGLKEKTFTVYRSLDGLQLSAGRMPDTALSTWEGLNWGRLIPCRQSSNGHVTLKVFDPVTAQEAWQLDIGENHIRVDRHVGGKYWAGISRDGILSVRDVLTGDELWHSQLADADDVTRFETISMEDQVLVVTSRGESRAVPAPEMPDEPAPRKHTVTLNTVDAATGQLQWTRIVDDEFNYSVFGLPSRWPVLALVGVKEEEPAILQNNRFRGFTSSQVMLRVLDRATGEEVVVRHGMRTGTIGWVGERVPFHRIKLRVGAADVVLKCLDTPVARDGSPNEGKKPNQAPEQNE